MNALGHEKGRRRFALEVADLLSNVCPRKLLVALLFGVSKDHHLPVTAKVQRLRVPGLRHDDHCPRMVPVFVLWGPGEGLSRKDMEKM